MFVNRMKPFWIALAIFGLMFAILFSIRLDLFNKFLPDPINVSLLSTGFPPDNDSWMNIFQNDRKIGYSHKTFSKNKKGYLLKETLYMRINTMGLVQDISLRTCGKLNSDFTLSSFDFEISSGRFRFAAQGAVSGDILSIKTHSFGSTRNVDIKIKERIYIAAGMVNAIRGPGIKPGDEFTFQIFDPVTLGQESVSVKVIGKEEILNMGINKTARKVAMIFKGLTQLAWIGENGEVLKEKGLLGINLEKTTRGDALFGLPIESAQDLTKVASIPSNVLIDDAPQLTKLEIEISGIKYNDVHLDGGRQAFKNNVLAIQKESLPDLIAFHNVQETHNIEKKFLEPTPFIQSDHPKIKNLAKRLCQPMTILYKRQISWLPGFIIILKKGLFYLFLMRLPPLKMV